MYSLVIPVYMNEGSLDRLLDQLIELGSRVSGELEVVFVVDGSPDRSLEILRERLPAFPLATQLVSLSRNFGSFAAIAAGLKCARGEFLAVMTADLQEPPALIASFFEILGSGRADIVFGVRSGRSDPWLSELLSSLFWWVFRRLVIKDMPPGGVDVFGCSRQVCDRLLQLPEISSNLIVSLFWLGFRREYVVYQRAARLEGKSAWTTSKKLRHGLKSIFSFTDLPIRVLLYLGSIAFVAACTGSGIVIVAKLRGDIPVPGYTPIVLASLFFGALTSLGFGIVGQYLWLALPGSHRRPEYIIRCAEEHGPSRTQAAGNDDPRS
jgi:glycosyltransferase involved in cell wall biosynthesis